MRILMIGNLYPSPARTTGDVVAMEERAAGYMRLGHRVRVISSVSSPTPALPESKPILEVVTHTIGKTALQAALLKLSKFIVPKLANKGRVTEELRAWKPDVVDVGNISGVSVFSLIPVIRESIPFVVNVADKTYLEACGFGSSQYEKLIKLLGKSSFDELKKINLSSCSRYIRQVYMKQGFRGERIAHIPYGCQIPALPIPEVTCGPLRLLYVGRFVEEKGPQVLLEAIGKVRAAGVPCKLTLLGDTPAQGGINPAEYAERFGLHGVVELLPAVLRGQVGEIIRRHDILVVPSIWDEPFGLVAVEAMANGVPVIATRTGGLQELVEDGSQGMVVDPGDPDALAEAVRRADSDRAMLQKMAVAGRQRAVQLYSAERYVDRSEAALKAAVQGRFEQFALESVT